MVTVDALAEALALELFPAEASSSADAPVISTPIVDWIQERFFIVETERPMVLEPHQIDILNLFTELGDDGRFKYKNLLYSTIKKSAKTSISAAYMRWAAECWGPYQEIYHMGNKLDQAKKRAFRLMRYSIELGPQSFQQEWEIKQTRMTHMSGSIVEALPINAAGEAGGNQSLTVWTELWGYRFEEDERMFNEMQPVATRKLGQRFAESYAGYEGESNLLKRLWDLALAGKQVSKNPPLYVNEQAGLAAYVDTGETARRMAWQVGALGKKYYAEQAHIELPHEYKRLHLNEWVTGQSALMALPLWDRLNYSDPANGISKPEAFQIITMAADASVTGDSTALVTLGIADDKGYELETFIWDPPKGGALDYAQTLTPEIEAGIERWKPQVIAYDPYQLHDVMTQLTKKYPSVMFYAFPQTKERLEADTMLVKRIIQGEIYHSGNEALRAHIQNADAKTQASEKTVRIVKRDPSKKVDAVVALSMVAHKAFELQIPTSVIKRIRVIET